MNISKPEKIKFNETENKNRGLVEVEPCYPGYGMTLGNALRRVLLSSLSGAAVVGVKIKGADHEFMPISYIKEDVLDIILNLKQLRLEILSDDEEVKLELEVAGKKKVTAADIKKNQNVDIKNPELYLAEITDMAGGLEAEIFVSKGTGYRTVDQVENKKGELGYIEMDSVFSPIVSVGINIENVRVGKMTNWDKLVLDIETDGTVSPKEAFEKSVNILIEQFSSLLEEKKDEKESKKKEKADSSTDSNEEKKKKKTKKDEDEKETK